MKKTIVCAVAMAGLTAFADASRAVVTMVDGSNVKGGSLIDKIEGDAIFGDDVSVPVELLKSIETVGTNGAAKLVFANGDAISLKLDTAAITIDSMLGRIEVPFKNIRKVVFSKSGGAKCGAGGSSVFIGKMPATLPESGNSSRWATAPNTSSSHFHAVGQSPLFSAMYRTYCMRRKLPRLDQRIIAPVSS